MFYGKLKYPWNLATKDSNKNRPQASNKNRNQKKEAKSKTGEATWIKRKNKMDEKIKNINN